MVSWIENVPDETWPLPLVKHETWRVLSKQQKVDAVEIAIRREMDKI
jgi:hypothetical protein